MAEAVKNPYAIPQRADIESKLTWQLTDLYKTDADWEAAFKKAESLIEQAEKFAGKLAQSPETLFQCLETQTQFAMVTDDLYQYAKLNQDLDSRVSKFQEMCDRATMLASRGGAAFAYVEPELLHIDEQALTDMAARFPDTTLYDLYIREFNRSRSHIRSGEVEELLAQSMMIARGPQAIFSMFDAADIKYPEITDEYGEKVRLTKQRFAKFMDSPIQSVRKEANDKFYEPYKSHLNTLGSVLSTSISKDVFYARVRRYESALHAGLDAHNIPVSVYHSLIETTEKNLECLHKYMAVRKKILKLDTQYPYDIFCPLFPDADYEISYDAAVQEVLRAVEPLGRDYGSILRDGFASRWVDVFETEGKAGGAYSWRNYNSHPFVLMNYNNTLSNMFTLAHEMGHAMHSYLSNRTQPFQKSQYSIFVAEVASTLNEGLLMRLLLSRTSDTRTIRYLINRQLTGAMGTYFHQVMYAHFEFMIHDMIENGKALSPDIMSKLWSELTIRYYGPSITMDEFSQYKWSRIPHFYTQYYVYQYATSFAASQAILRKLIDGESGIIDRYLELLSSGGNDYPINQLKKCGVDMTSSVPFEATIKLFSELVDDIDRLAE